MTRKQPMRYKLRRWFRKNILAIILLTIVLISMSVGGVIGRVTAKQPNSEEYEEVATTPPVDRVSYIPVLEPFVEKDKPVFYFNVPLSEELQDYIRELCGKYNVPMEVVIAIIDVESNFRPGVISKTNDHGLMQINTCNHEWLKEELAITNILDPFQNILGGIYIFSGHLEKTDGNIEKALMRYNNGATGAKRLWNKGIYSTSYSKKVMTAYLSYLDENK